MRKYFQNENVVISVDFFHFSNGQTTYVILKIKIFKNVVKICPEMKKKWMKMKSSFHAKSLCQCFSRVVFSIHI